MEPLYGLITALFDLVDTLWPLAVGLAIFSLIGEVKDLRERLNNESQYRAAMLAKLYARHDELVRRVDQLEQQKPTSTTLG